MVTVISRPLGHKLGTIDLSAQIIDDGHGYALVYTGSSHGLSDGDYVFIESNFDSYNGFKYVDSISYDAFKIKDSEGGDYTPFKQNANVTFRVSSLDHGYNSVHLPIVYELRSDLWPINVGEEEYTPVIADSVENNNGYTQLNLDRAIEDLTALNYIKLVGNGDMEGVYQIMEVLQPWSIVINLVYDASNDLSIYAVQNYYNNYFITVYVYGGLDQLHPWYNEKPYELLATLKLIPDSDGEIKFSIAEILKGQITTRNNLTLDTLPNNIDFFTKYYIEYSESYDQSNGTDITVYTGDISSDLGNIDAMAINSKLEFKNINSGTMSDYVFVEGYPARWLSTMERPLGIVDRFFDLSFIKNVDGDFSLLINGELSQAFTDLGKGVYRIPIDMNVEGEKCCKIQIGSQPGFSPASLDTLDLWYNINTGGQYWDTGGSFPFLDYNTYPTPLDTSDFLATDYLFDASKQYSFLFSFTNYNPITSLLVNGNNTAVIAILDSSNNILTQQSYSVGTNLVNTYTVIPPFGSYKIAVRLVKDGGSVINCNFRIDSFINTTQSTPDTEPQDITETICIDVIEECSSTFVNDDLRLTEGGQFRELE